MICNCLTCSLDEGLGPVTRGCVAANRLIRATVGMTRQRSPDPQPALEFLGSDLPDWCPGMEEPTPPARAPIVLIANDQEWSARSLESIFVAEGYSVVRAFTGTQALQKAETVRPDVIILDRQMPDLDGVEVCTRLRTDPRFGAAIPIVITTAGQAGRTQRLEAYRAGAWDFIGQPIDGETILLKIRNFLGAKLAVDHARLEGMLDESTGLYSRIGLTRRAREVASEATRHQQPVACVVIAIDAPALAAAAEATEEFARKIACFFRTSGRSSDVVARLGPMEFGVIAPSTSAEGVASMVERVEASLVTTRESSADDLGPVGLSTGYFAVANFAEAGVDPLDMIVRAGAALTRRTIESRPTAS